MSRFLILRRFQGGLQGTNRILRFVCDQGMCGVVRKSTIRSFDFMKWATLGAEGGHLRLRRLQNR